MYYSDGCYTALTKLGFSSQLLAKLSPAAKAHLMNAGVGAAGGAVLGGENNRMSGALGGAALGLGAGHVMGQAAEGAAAKKGLSSVEQAAEGAATHRPSGESMRAIETKAPTQAAAESVPAQADPFAGMLPQSLPPDGMPPIPKAPPVPGNLGPQVPGTPMPMREPSAMPSSQPVAMDSMPPPVSGMRPTNYPDTMPVGNSMLPTMQPVAKTGSVIPPRLFLPITKMAMDPILEAMLSHPMASRTLTGGAIGAGLGGIAGAGLAGEDNRGRGALTGALIGGAGGMASGMHYHGQNPPGAAAAKSAIPEAEAAAAQAALKTEGKDEARQALLDRVQATYGQTTPAPAPEMPPEMPPAMTMRANPPPEGL